MTVGLLSVLIGLEMLMIHVRIFKSSDFVADLNYFFIQSVLLENSVFDYFSETGVGLNKFEGLVFEVNLGIRWIQILNIWNFELGLR